MTLLAIDHVQLAMPGGARPTLCAFYAGILGLIELAKPDSLAARGGCWFESGAVKVHLGVDPDFHAAGKAHPAFLVDDVKALEAAVTNAGYRVATDVPLAGYVRIHIYDPFGNRIELMQKVSS